MIILIALSFLFISIPNLATGADNVDAKVLIVGGGPAGIQSAATLLENGIDDFLIIEDCAQLRGYLEPLEFGGRTFAPGGLFGFTPIKDKLNDLDIAYTEPDFYSYKVYDDNGENITSEAVERENDFFTSVYVGYSDIIKDLDMNVKPDISQKAAIARGGWSAYTAVDKLMEWWNFDFFQGISSRDGSTINAYRQAGLFPDHYFILDDRTLAYPLLSAQEDMIPKDKIIWNERVRVVNQTAGDCVTVVTENGTEFTGEYVILTSTVGVIQNGFVTFDPLLPPWKYEEYCRWQMGTIDTIFLKFDTKFWDDTEFILHASDIAGNYPAFMNLEAEGYHPAGTNILIGFVTGDEAYRIERLSDEEVMAEVVEVLRNMYGDDVPEPTEFYMTRWITDVDHFGQFTTWPIGTLPEDGQMRLRAHVNRLYFAPEDAADAYIGIPFGSINDGKAAAMGIVRCCETGDCDGYTPVDSTLPLCRDVNPSNPRKYRKTRP